MSPRRRVLMLLPFAPRRDASHGGARVMAETIAALAAHHDLALLYLRAAAELPIDAALAARCALVAEVVRSPRPLGSVRQVFGFLRGEPLWVAHWREPAYAARLHHLVAQWQPEIVQLEYHVMAQYLSVVADAAPTVPTVLVEYEPGHAAAHERAARTTGLARWVRRRDAHAWATWERAALASVDAVVAFTARDLCSLGALTTFDTPTVAIAPGVTVPARACHPAGTTPGDVVFVGNYVHPPNRDAAWRLATVIHPRVRAAFPAARLVLVGDGPPHALQALAGADVVVTGRVPDVTPWLDGAAVVVAPLRQGGGMRVKVLEALAAGKAVVASPLAVEGIAVVDGEHCLLAERDEDIAAAIAGLLADPERRVRLVTAARAFAFAHLGWPRVVADYDALYTRLLTPASATESVADVSVAVATCERPEALARCLTALLAGPVRPAEILVVDQGSNDAAERMLAALAPPAGVRLRYLRQERRGLAASRNAAGALATCAVVAVTDDDCVPAPDWVATLAGVFAARPGCGAVTGRVLPLGAPSPETYPVSSRTATERREHTGRALPWAVGTGANVAVRREVLTASGGYDERLGVGTAGGAGEDTDLLHRLLRAGVRICYEPRAIVYHERQSRDRRLATRGTYGKGIGACCALWLRTGDAAALAMLGRWTASRLRRLARAAVRGDGMGVREELRVCAGTVAGLRYGATLATPRPASAHTPAMEIGGRHG